MVDAIMAILVDEQKVLRLESTLHTECTRILHKNNKDEAGAFSRLFFK